MGYPSSASEFPNDNVDISSGARWLNEHLTGPVAVELPPAEAAPQSSALHEPVSAERFVLHWDDEEPDFDGPPTLTLTEAGPLVVVETRTPEPEAPGPLRQFQAALARVLMTRGASRAASLLATFLRLEPLAAESVPEELERCLQERGYLDPNGRYSEKFRALWGAWSAVLASESGDLAACGSTTLDGFGAQLLTALLTLPASRAEELRRELRKAGIAAFGVLEVAA